MVKKFDETQKHLKSLKKLLITPEEAKRLKPKKKGVSK